LPYHCPEALETAALFFREIGSGEENVQDTQSLVEEILSVKIPSQEAQIV